MDSKEMMSEYLNTVLEKGDDADVINAIGHVAKAIGMAKISEETGLSRTSLFKALCDEAKPHLPRKTETIDWWETIQDQERDSILLGIEDAENNKLKVHSSAKKLYEKWL